jgi:transcriptional antiterminator NusG
VSTEPEDVESQQPMPSENLDSAGENAPVFSGSGTSAPVGDTSLPGKAVGDPEANTEDRVADDQVTEDDAAEDDAAEDDAAEDDAAEDDAAEDEEVEDVEPLELILEPSVDEELSSEWYILKVQVNREDSIRDALQRRVKVEGMDRFFKEIVVPTEDVAEFTKSGKRRVVKRKLYPGYIMVNMHINDETWFLVRETPGIGDFTGSAGKPTPMLKRDVDRILNIGKADDGIDTHVKTAIPFKQSDRVRVKDGYFQNFEGDVESVDEANGRVTVMINIFGRSTPVELEHWQIEAV